MSIVGRDIYPSHLASRLKSLPYWGGLRASPDTHQRPARTVPACPTPANWRILTYPPRRCDGASGGCGRSPRPGRPPPPTGLLGLRSAKSLLPRAASRQGRHPAASALIPLRPAAAPIPAPSPPTGNLTPTTPGPWTPSHGDRGARASRRPGEGPRRTRIVRPPRQQQPRRGSALQCPPATQPALPLEVRGAAPPAVDGLARPAGGGPPFPHISSGHRQGRKWHIYVPGSKRVWEGDVFVWGGLCTGHSSIQSGPPGQSQTPALSTLNEIEAAARRQLVNILERGPPVRQLALFDRHDRPSPYRLPANWQTLRGAVRSPTRRGRSPGNAQTACAVVCFLDARPGPESPQPPRLAANWHCSTVTTGHPPIASPPTGKRFEERSGPPHVHAHVPSPPGRQLALFDRHDRPTHPWFPATTPKALLGRQCQLANWQD
ncbi:hypothetical protein MAP00_009247 [Monascus purpureus]|nr:hypothetical protein MAP00_009247 [Monascus purpureus]